MRRTGWESAALGCCMGLAALLAPAAAHAQSAPPLLVVPSASRLPGVPELRLSWPISPLSFSFTGREEGNYPDGPLRLFRAEALWLSTPRFQLLTAASAERAFELDCWLTCKPIINRVLALEARFPLLPASVADKDALYGYIRSSSAASSQSRTSIRTVSIGLGGLLDF